jgi:hypothetical protein
MKKFAILLAFLLCVTQMSAQTIDIKGTVTDENGDPLHGCYIHTSESRYTMTDVLGYYSIPITYNKTVKIHYECIGYCDVVLTFSPERAFPTSPDVKMVPDSTAMDDLPVVGLPYVDLADKSGPCPRCGSEKVLPILYGVTTEKGYEAIQNGEYVSGGSMVGRANYACASCKQRFYVREAPSKTENTSVDSLMVVVDGIGYVAPVESDLVLHAFTFISDEDIESIDLIKKDHPGFIIFHRPKDILLITTRKESEIHDFYLDGQAVHKKKGIRLGYLFDESLLKQQIKKNWKIHPSRIKSLSVDGREIRIKTR